MLFFGTMNLILVEFMFAAKIESSTGEVMAFQKPCTTVFFMFVGMALTWPLYKLVSAFSTQCEKQDPTDNTALLNHTDSTKQNTEVQRKAMIALTAFIGLLANAISYSSLLFVAGSTYAILRGSQLVFTSILSIVILGRAVTPAKWQGIGLVLISCAIVGLASKMTEHGKVHAQGFSSTCVGIAIVIVGQFFEGLYCVCTERLAQDFNMEVPDIVGALGAIGSLIMMLLVFPFVDMAPGFDNGHLEDIHESFHMIAQSPYLAVLVACYVANIGMWNICSTSTTKILSAIHTSMCLCGRMTLVWTFNLAWFYLFDTQAMYAEYLGKHSVVQVLGFGIYVYGVLVFGGQVASPMEVKATTHDQP